MMALECTCSALRMAARRLTQIYDAAVATEGVNISQYALLGRLSDWPGDPPTIRQLAERSGLDRTTLAHNLRPLERDGLIAVAADPNDRRVKRISLTARGLAKRTACRPLWRAAQDRFERDFGASHAASLMASLQSIAQGPVRPAATRRGEEKPHAG